MNSLPRTKPTTRKTTEWSRIPALIAAGAVLTAAVAHCSANSAAPDGQGGGPTLPSDSASNDASSSTIPDHVAPAADSSVGSAAFDAGAIDEAASDRAVGDDASSSAGDASMDASSPPVWATWPMPNAPSSGLPNPQSYDTSTAGVAVDRVTGLVWQRDATLVSTAQEGDVTSILEQAAAVCAALDLAGYRDWRVPSRIELVSLLDFAEDPASNASVFPAGGDLADAFYLSSSQHALGTANATVGEVWLTAPGVGYAEVGALPPIGDAAISRLQGPDAVRCVRGQGNASGPHYTIGSGTVRDNWTGLTWVQSPSSSPMEPSAVPSYCASLAQNGGGWRAPSANELETLWGDFTDPDTVRIDPETFPATAQLNQGIGSVNTYLPYADSAPAEWVDVVGFASTYHQEDVAPGPTFPGFESPEGYWFYAQCVR